MVACEETPSGEGLPPTGRKPALPPIRTRGMESAMRSQSIKDAYFQLVRYASLPNTALKRLQYRLGGRNRPEGYYVHLGCGFKYLDGLINTDGNIFRKIDLWIDLRNRLPFPSSSCRLVYSSHTIEHMFPYEAITLLREIRRVLRRDGTARIAVPSMEYALQVAGGEHVEDWPRRFDDSVAQAVNYLFCDGQHKYAYSFGILAHFAREAGFSRIVNYSADHGVEPKRYGDVVVGDEPTGSLVVELAA
jgi:predicted SAM-dependent methyltransferase